MIGASRSNEGTGEVDNAGARDSSPLPGVLSRVVRAESWTSETNRGIVVDALLMFLSRAASQGATFVTIVLVARVLGATEFGLYAFATTVALLLSEFPGSGLDMTAVRLASANWAEKRPVADFILRVAGELKVAIVVVVAVIGLAASDLLAALFGKPELAGPLRVAFLAAAAIAVMQYALAVMQTHQLFRRYSLVTLGTGLAKIATILALFVAGLFTLGAALATLLAGVYLGLLLSLALVPRQTYLARGRRAQHLHHIFRYGRWLTVATFLGTLANGLDVMALTYFASTDVVGLYSSGRTLAMVVPLLSNTVLTVLLPVASRLTDRRALTMYVVRAEAVVAVLSIGIGLLIFVAPSPIGLLFTPKYASATVLFQVLALAYTADLLAVPLWTLLLARNRPDALAAMNVGLLAVVLPAFVLAVPHYGALGAALVFLGWKVIGGLMSLGWVFRAMPADGGRERSATQGSI